MMSEFELVEPDGTIHTVEALTAESAKTVLAHEMNVEVEDLELAQEVELGKRNTADEEDYRDR